ncbi:MAG: NAD-dependent epimerase/dehydratase family protein [Chloroflexota bacterium]
MTVVVTGASGHVGANLVRALLDQGRTVRSLVHVNRQALAGLDIEIVEGDIGNPESLLKAFDGAEVVYHLAAAISLLMSSWPLLERVNVIGTRNVVEACLRSGVRRLVHFSSIHALRQEPLEAAVNESRPLVDSPRCPPYDRSKAAGEIEICRGLEKGLDAVIVSPTAIIGPHDYRPSHFGRILLDLARGQLAGLVAGGFDWVDARDVACTAIRAEEVAPTGAKYLLSGHWVSLCDLADMVAAITGTAAPRFVCPLWLARAGAPLVTAFNRLAGKRPLYTSAAILALCGNRSISHDRATRELGYEPRPLRETLAATLEWFVATGQLDRPLKPEPGPR